MKPLMIIFSVFAIMVMALNGAQNSKALPPKVTLTEEFSIDTEKFAEKIGAIGSFDVDKKGNLYLLDRKLHKIIVINDKGEFLKEFGRKGQGPGEFQIPINIQVKAPGKLVVTDLKNRKFVIFQKDGKLIKDIKLNFRISGGVMLDNGNFLFQQNKFPKSMGESIKIAWQLHNSNFELVKELAERESLNPFASKIMGINYNISVGISRDKIIIGNPVSGYDILVYDFNGKLLKKIVKKYTTVPPSEEYKKAYIERLGKSYGMIKTKLVFPEFLPPFHNLLTDEEGRIFVFTYEKDKNSPAYMVDVFSREGEFFSRIPFKFSPYARNIKQIKNNRLHYVYEQDSGFQKIVIYKISW